MMGRATRLCPAIGKTHFEIYDPVGVYTALDPYSTSYDDLLAGLEVLTTEAQLKNQLELIIAKRQLDQTGLAQFADLTGSDSPDNFIKILRQMTVKEATKTLLKNPELFEILQRSTRPGRQPVVVSDKDDELLSHTRGYGEGQKPQDYLDELRPLLTPTRIRF